MGKKLTLKECGSCEMTFGANNYIETKSFLFPDGHLNLCNGCIEQLLKKNADNNWEVGNKLCQYADFPFIIVEWEKLYLTNKEKTFLVYSRMYGKKEYEGPSWQKYNNEYLRLEKIGAIDIELPGIREERERLLKEKWGPNYCPEDIIYLENLLEGLMNTQGINGVLQKDQAMKLCKISLLIDVRIRDEQDFEKLLSGYDKLVKIADFTPKSAKNVGSFESVGELYAFLEKRGWLNKFYDGAVKDEVDNTIKNIQSYLRRIYINENGIGEETERRIESLKSAKILENKYSDEDNDDDELDTYENGALEDLKEDAFEVDM